MKDLGVGYSFCDERVCTCRPEPRQILEKWGGAGQKRCPAGKEFGVIGVDGKFRECLHTVARREVGWEKFSVARAKKARKGVENEKS